MREFGRLTALLLKVRFLARARRTRLALAQEVFLRVRADLQRRSAAAHEERNHLCTDHENIARQHRRNKAVSHQKRQLWLQRKWDGVEGDQRRRLRESCLARTS